MLLHLKVKNLAVIDEAELELGQGFVCLTGESGAGKSVLIDALLLLSGGRASADVVRAGCDKCVIEAAFELDHQDPDLELLEGPELFLRREINAQGRSRAFVNGAMVPSSVLAQYAAPAFEIHGQHGQQRLLKKTAHLDIFDRQTGIAERARVFYQQLETFRAAHRAYWELVDGESQRLKEIDFLQLQIKEIEAVKPTQEDADLDARLKRARNAETIRACRGELADLLGGSLSRDWSRAEKLLNQLLEFEPGLGPYMDQLSGASAVISDLHAEIAYSDDGFSDNDLRKLEDRENALNKLYMKYGRDLDEVLSEQARLKTRLEELSGEDTDLDKRRARLADDYARLLKSRDQLIKARNKAAEGFAQTVTDGLHALEMARARFCVENNPPEWPAQIDDLRDPNLKADDFSFTLSANPGEPPRQLAKVASGGELSRVLLALIGAFARPSGRLLVFDEIDAGLGGEAAHKVGLKLSQLGAHRQVLCVTHFAQVARYADQLIKLEKRVVDDRTATALVICSPDQRVDELARLMGGEGAGEDLKAHARKLVAEKLGG